MEILAFYPTAARARAARGEMLGSGFDPLEVAIYGSEGSGPEERANWFAFADSAAREEYQQAIAGGATAVVVELGSASSAELRDGEVAVEILERHGPLDEKQWPRVGREGTGAARRQDRRRATKPIANWHPAEAMGSAGMRRGLRHHGELSLPEGNSRQRSGMSRFIAEFIAGHGHHGRDWNSSESDLRRAFAARYPESDWDASKDPLHREYDRQRLGSV